MTDQQQTNGRPTWRDFHDLEGELRNADETTKAEIMARFEKAHIYWNDAHKDTITALNLLTDRIDCMESVLDQQRGARALVYFLIGSNLMVVLGILLALGAAVWS